MQKKTKGGHIDPPPIRNKVNKLLVKLFDL